MISPPPQKKQILLQTMLSIKSNAWTNKDMCVSVRRCGCAGVVMVWTRIRQDEVYYILCEYSWEMYKSFFFSPHLGVKLQDRPHINPCFITSLGLGQHCIKNLKRTVWEHRGTSYLYSCLPKSVDATLYTVTIVKLYVQAMCLCSVLKVKYWTFVQRRRREITWYIY